MHRGWLYYDGGGSSWYYTSAWVLGHGNIPPSTTGFGYSLLLAPIALIAGSNLLAGLPYVLLLNAVVLSPIALLAIYGLAKAIGGLRFAYLTAVVWGPRAAGCDPLLPPRLPRPLRRWLRCPRWWG